MSGVDDADWSAVADAAHAEWVGSEFEAERDSLRKDAERYRWLRGKIVDENDELTADSVDAEFDKGMEEE